MASGGTVKIVYVASPCVIMSVVASLRREMRHVHLVMARLQTGRISQRNRESRRELFVLI